MPNQQEKANPGQGDYPEWYFWDKPPMIAIVVVLAVIGYFLSFTVGDAKENDFEKLLFGRTVVSILMLLTLPLGIWFYATPVWEKKAYWRRSFPLPSTEMVRQVEALLESKGFEFQEFHPGRSVLPQEPCSRILLLTDSGLKIKFQVEPLNACSQLHIGPETPENRELVEELKGLMDRGGEEEDAGVHL